MVSCLEPVVHRLGEVQAGSFSRVIDRLLVSLGLGRSFASLGWGLAFGTTNGRLGSGCFEFGFGSSLPVFPHLDVRAVDVLRRDLEPVVSKPLPGDSTSLTDDFHGLFALALVVVHFREVAEELAERLVLLVVLVSVADDLFRGHESLLEVTSLHQDEELDLFQLADVELVLDAVSLEPGDGDGVLAVFVALLGEENRDDGELGSEPQADVRVLSLLFRLFKGAEAFVLQRRGWSVVNFLVCLVSLLSSCWLG